MLFLRNNLTGHNLLAMAAAIFMAVASSNIRAAISHETSYHSNVLGTSLEIRIAAPQTQSHQAQQAVLAEIKRLEKIFSSYDSHSELSQLNSDLLKRTPSAELLEMIHLCEQWRAKMPRAFSCRMGNVINAWRQAFARQVRPQRKAIRAIARRAQESQFVLSDLKNGTRDQDFSWNFGAIAKGYILDKALQTARRTAPQATAIGIDIGGDSRYWQAPAIAQPWQITVADPTNIDDSKQINLGLFTLKNGAIAYSGHNSRARVIQQRSYSHILTPRDGWPTPYASSVVVSAPTATEADALATALATMAIPTALNWLERHNNSHIAVLLIGADGRQQGNHNWYRNFRAKGQQVAANRRIDITFALPTPKGGNYRKPYVALWVEDSHGQVVKNLLLLGDNERWMSKNRYWWRKQGRSENNLLEGLARPTRRPGEYQFSWNGRDDFGILLESGNYTLYMEAAREHGDHERIRIPFALAAQSGVQPGTQPDVEATQKHGQKEIKFLSLAVLPPEQAIP